jgi:hypothetical protein
VPSPHRLSDGAIVEADGETLDTLERGLQRMRSQIDGMLLTQRLEAREMECRPVDVSLGRIMADATRAAQLEANQKGVEFVARYDSDVNVYVDPGLATSALPNVVDNAVKIHGPWPHRGDGGGSTIGRRGSRLRQLRRSIGGEAANDLRTVQTSSLGKGGHRPRGWPSRVAPLRRKGDGSALNRAAIAAATSGSPYRNRDIDVDLRGSRNGAAMARILIVNDEVDLLTLCRKH